MKALAETNYGYCVEGDLLSDPDDLDGVVVIRDASDGEIVSINGWLWSIEVYH